MNKKVLLITLIILLAVLGAAAILYPRLSEGMQPQQMATTPTNPPETTQPTQATQAPQESQEQEEPTEPMKAPDFTVLDWDGNEVKLSDYFGKPIVLNFWTYWCDYCLLEMPEFNAVYEELGGEVTFLMVHADTDTQSGKQLVADAGYTFPMVFDEARNAKMTYGINSYPVTLFIDSQGYLQAYYMGMMGRELLQTGIDMIYAPESQDTSE